MPAQTNLHIRQTPLRVRGAKHAGARHRAQAQLTMIRHEKLILGRLLEPLHSVPRHVLNHQARAVGDENHIE